MARRATPRALALLPALALVAAGCAQPIDQGRSADGKVPIVEPGKLTVCTHLDYKPFQFHQRNEVVGFDVDIVDLVARDLGVRQSIVDTPFEGIQSGEDLNTGHCDVSAAAMSITAVREKNFDFSDPYFEAKQALMTRQGSPVRDLAGLRGKKVGVQLSTTGEEFANDNKAANGFEVVQFEDLPLSVTAVQTGQVDAAINDSSVLADFIRTNPAVRINSEFRTGDQYGIGVRSGNVVLKSRIDDVLRRAKASGEYARIHAKWFGTAQ